MNNRAARLLILHAARPLTLCINGVYISAALEIIDTTTCEGMAMQITLNVNVLVKDGALVLTDHTGKTVTFSKEQTVQQKVSMIALGELCALPKRQLATGFGFKTRKSQIPSDLVVKFCVFHNTLDISTRYPHGVS